MNVLAESVVTIRNPVKIIFWLSCMRHSSEALHFWTLRILWGPLYLNKWCAENESGNPVTLNPRQHPYVQNCHQFTLNGSSSFLHECGDLTFLDLN